MGVKYAGKTVKSGRQKQFLPVTKTYGKKWLSRTLWSFTPKKNTAWSKLLVPFFDLTYGCLNFKMKIKTCQKL